MNFSQLIDYNNGGVLIIILGILIFFCTTSASTSSAISREGASAWVMKTIPISLKKQLDAKVYFSLIIDLITALVIEIASFLVFRFPFTYILLINIPLLLGLLISNYISILLDLRRPKLDWKDENEAVKQNIIIFFAIALNLLASGLVIVLGAIAYTLTLNIYLAFGIISAIFLIIYLVLITYIKKNDVKLFRKVF